MVYRRRSVSSVDGVGIGEVLIHRYRLAWDGNDDREVDRGRVDRDGTCCSWGGFPVIVHITQSWLISREGGTVRVRCRSPIDDSCGVAVEGVGGGVESIFEVVALARLTSGENWSFETGWEGGKFSILVEVSEEVVSHCCDVAGIETSLGKTRQRTIRVEGSEEAWSYRCDIACIKTSRWQTR